jgi:hypothetical protein
VHFLTPSGDDVVVGPGTYEVEATEQGLRLKPKDGKPEDAKVIQATPLPHAETLDTPKAIAETIGEDALRVALLLPEEKGLEAVGSYSGIQSRAICSTCTALGTYALSSNTTGGANTAIAFNALKNNTIGHSNTALGASALFANQSGTLNTALGANSLNQNTTSHENTAVGSFALERNTVGQNTAVGANALRLNTTGGYNTALGHGALRSNKDGTENTAVGYLAGASAAVSLNTAIGSNAFGGGSQNVAVGAYAKASGNSNVAVGFQAMKAFDTGDYNIVIGFQGGLHNQAGGSHNIYLASGGASGESNTIRIGKSPGPGGNPAGGQHRAFIAGITGVAVSGAPLMVTPEGQLGIRASSLRYKDDIRDMAEASQDLYKLRPVTFRYKPELAGKDAAREYGLIAEEVDEVYPDLVGRDAEGTIVTVKYHELIPMLLNEVQKEHRTGQDLIRQNQKQNGQLQEQQQQIQALMVRMAALEGRDLRR